MLGIDLSETSTVQLADVDWTIGLLPLLKFDEFQDALEISSESLRQHFVADHRAADGSFDDTSIRGCARCTMLNRESERTLRPVYREIVRWGLRGTNAPGLTLEMETTKAAGREYQLVSESMVERLARVAEGRLVSNLATEIIKANRLSEKEVLGFK